MTTKPRSTLLTTAELYNLDVACQVIRRAFPDGGLYLVGTAGVGAADGYRDVDVRLMLGDEDFTAACPTRERWELLCVAVSAWLSDRTGLPVDFQVQLTSVANEKHGDKPRNPLGMGRRIFAGGGDATPDWAATDA